MDVLIKVKEALRISTTRFDTEIADLIEAACEDMGVAGVVGENAVETNPLFLRAIITYVKIHFGEPDDADRLKKSYDEQKAQLVTATGWTNWGV